MKDKTLKILLGIIAINLTVQTVKDVGLFPTAYAQSITRVAICDARAGSRNCAGVSGNSLNVYDWEAIRELKR
jgi:hypothetical protein